MLELLGFIALLTVGGCMVLWGFVCTWLSSVFQGKWHLGPLLVSGIGSIILYSGFIFSPVKVIWE